MQTRGQGLCLLLLPSWADKQTQGQVHYFSGNFLLFQLKSQVEVAAVVYLLQLLLPNATSSCCLCTVLLYIVILLYRNPPALDLSGLAGSYSVINAGFLTKSGGLTTKSGGLPAIFAGLFGQQGLTHQAKDAWLAAVGSALSDATGQRLTDPPPIVCLCLLILFVRNPPGYVASGLEGHAPEIFFHGTRRLWITSLSLGVRAILFGQQTIPCANSKSPRNSRALCRRHCYWLRSPLCITGLWPDR